MLHDRTLLNHGSHYIYMQPSSFNKAVVCALGMVWKTKNVTEGRTTDGNTACLYGKDVLVWLPTDTASMHVQVLPFVFFSRIHFGKEEAAYRHH